MRGPTGVALGSLVVLAAILWSLAPEPGPGPGEDRGVELVLFCAAGVRAPVEELCAEYERRYGVRVAAQYGGSGTMLSALQAARRGDLYLAGDDSFTASARAKGLVAEVFPLAEMRPVIGVGRGNPRAVAGPGDLVREELRVGIGEPDATAIGQATRALLEASGHWEALQRARKVAHPTVNQLATDLAVGALDAAVIWDATAGQFEGVEAVRVPAFEAAAREVTLGVLTASEQPTAALRLARFLASSDVGMPVLERHGFRPVPGDPWQETPRLELKCGAMLNAAVDLTLRTWAAREGVVIDFEYNGCGLLVDGMRARGEGPLPDAYFSCDVSFLDLVEDLFTPGLVVSSNPIVIVTPPDNPRGVTSLADLAAEGLRVGLAHPEKSALGALTARLLEREGLAQAVAPNVKLQSPTGDTLVNQLRTGSLDAVVVYTSNAARAGHAVARISVDLEGARAAQPFAIGKQTRHARLIERMFDALTTAESRTRFEELGFEWALRR